MDPETLIALIRFEQTNLERGHVYYSIDEQPEICARLIAPLFDSGPEPVDDDLPMDERFKVVRGAAREVTREEIYSHRVSVTVQGWHDVPAAIRLIRERQRKFKEGMGL